MPSSCTFCLLHTLLAALLLHQAHTHKVYTLSPSPSTSIDLQLTPRFIKLTATGRLAIDTIFVTFTHDCGDGVAIGYDRLPTADDLCCSRGRIVRDGVAGGVNDWRIVEKSRDDEGWKVVAVRSKYTRDEKDVEIKEMPKVVYHGVGRGRGVEGGIIEKSRSQLSYEGEYGNEQ